jgi:DNA-binding MarR family transcriptional regulator
MPLDEIQRRIMERLHEHGFDDLVLAHMAVLRYPGPDGKRPIDLATETNMSKQALNYLLGQFEQHGYLERRTDPDDHRSERVYTTARGESIREVILGAVREVEAEWAAAIGSDDVERLRAILHRLNGTLGSPGIA